MQVVMIVNNSLRHKYYANKILDNFSVTGIVCTERDYYMEAKVSGDIPLEYDGDDKVLMDWHFDMRKNTEAQYFREHDLIRLRSGTSYMSITRAQLNTDMVCSFVHGLQPDIVLVYGGPLIKSELLSACPDLTINMHAGLSPWYKGAATLFWPLYMQEPEKLGVTFHLVNERIDDGAIIHQHRPTIFAGDSQHSIGCRAIIEATDCALRFLEKYEKTLNLGFFKQRGGGKIWSKWDFRPHHLRVLKFLLDNGMLKEYLETKDSHMRKVDIITQEGI